MKTIIRTALFLILFTTLFNCSNDDDTTARSSYPDENPLTGYLSQTGFDEVTVLRTNQSSYYEQGLSFTPKVKGQINAITVKAPNANPSLKITLWDFDAQTVLRTETVNVVNANTEYTFPITALTLTKDKHYMISMNTNNDYYRYRTDVNNVIYPILIGNIEINSYQWRTGNSQIFPNITENHIYVGDCSFVFQQTP